MRDRLGAFVPGTDVRIAGNPNRPLSGLTFASKDIFDIAGHVTGCGNPRWAETHAPAPKTAPVVQAVLDAGAELIGKTITDELAFSLAGENVHYGTPVNSRCPERIPGGSSSGSASAVAGSACDFALGSDTGGSVRVPASFCGIYGIRTTHGRIALDGTMPLAPSFDTFGWFARDPDLLARIGSVYFGASPSALPTRMLIAEDCFALAESTVTDALRPAVQKAAAMIGSQERIQVAERPLLAWQEAFRRLQWREVWGVHHDWIEQARPSFGPGVADRFAHVGDITDAEVTEANTVRAEASARLERLLGSDSVLCLPASPGIAPLKGETGDRVQAFRTRAMSLTCIAGLARLPQISLPLAEVEGCPVALGLIGPRGGDEMLLDIARRLRT